MEFDDQMRRIFGTDDLGAVSPEAMASGIERMPLEAPRNRTQRLVSNGNYPAFRRIGSFAG